MTKSPFDQFSKQFLEAFLTPLGEVEISHEVLGESRLVDIWFTPSSTQTGTDPRNLGLLGRIATTACLLEPFRNQPTPREIRNCLLKLFLVQADFQRQARREEERIAEAELPLLWILASSASNTLISGFGASTRDDWLPGVYFLPESLKTAIIAINQLPTTPETLWVRILGRGATQQQAIEEVIALPTDDSKRSRVLQMLTIWRITMETSSRIDEEDRQLRATLARAYQALLEHEQEMERQALERGIQQGQRLVVENLLKVRFGELDEQLDAIVPRLLALPAEEYTSFLLQLTQLSREDLLARFPNPTS